MPNHCENELVVSGEKEAIEKFRGFAKDGLELLSADRFIPYPDEFKKLDEEARELNERAKKYPDDKELAEKAWKFKDGFNSGGYDWCVNNWGTKWGLYDVKLEDENNTLLFYTFRTAWSPAYPVIRKMSELFPSLTFENSFFERGVGFCGIYACKDGKVIKNITEDYDGERGG